MSILALLPPVVLAADVRLAGKLRFLAQFGWRERKMADELELVELVAQVARNLRRACLVGNPAPVVAGMWQDMANPELGDLVLEISSFRRKPFEPSSLGRLVRVEDEDEGERIWTIVPLVGPQAGQEVRWENADFIKVLIEPPHHS